ncbi:hypothetical protein ICN10_01480 [Polynucleobacter sp. 86C-FISCH]|uniref:hypothetical protein n=1 Tax=Polynucleobacter sp. 86C-FISCH TaxID=2689101 RepID=UPI001C0CB288|nr:hypothetical protein [Polynucleobacter sp. 86C-FISCH]MBU3595067.1 hypothetical protein [Polynucleobacter sp. 86C-FISCH]
MSTTVHFSIKYDGPALNSHQMDIRELAPALIALSNMLEEANKVAFPNSGNVKVNVQGNFKGGSFGVDLIAIQSITDQIVSILSGPEASAISNLKSILEALGLIGVPGAGLIGVIKWLRGRKPSSIQTSGDHVIFEVAEEAISETFEVDLVAGKLYQSRVVRKALASVVKPLERDGIDIFASGKDGSTTEVIRKQEAQWFEVPESDADVVSDSIAENILLQIESIAFKDDNKWRFSDGSGTFFAEIADPVFIEKINSGAERFGKGDVLVVDLRRVQTITDNGLKMEYSITRIHDHRAPLQHKLGL